MILVILFIVKLLLIKIRYGKCGIVLILRYFNVCWLWWKYVYYIGIY